MKHKHIGLLILSLSFLLTAVIPLIVFIPASLAQEMPDVIGVRMMDGNVIEGKVIKATAEIVTIQMKDGQIVTKKFSDVENFIKTGESTTPSPMSAPKSLLPVHSFEIGLEAFYKEYKEPDVMNEKGMMYGLGLAYTYHDKVMAKASLLVAYGEMNYENSGKVDSIPDNHWEIRGLLGYDFPIDPTLFITPYFGLGYRYLVDDSSGKISSTGARGYKRESTYFYGPVGISLIKTLPESWTLTAEAEFDFLWYGKQKWYPAGVEINNTQNQGYGLRASLRMEKKFSYNSFFIEPFIRYWDIAQSDNDIIVPGVLGYEPKNNTTEYGAYIGFKF